jgi:hypothetical protein
VLSFNKIKLPDYFGTLKGTLMNIKIFYDDGPSEPIVIKEVSIVYMASVAQKDGLSIKMLSFLDDDGDTRITLNKKPGAIYYDIEGHGVNITSKAASNFDKNKEFTKVWPVKK